MRVLNILVVDDEPSNLQIIRAILLNLGHHITTCEDGEKALSVLLDEGRHFDAVLLDVLIPKVDGLSVTQQLRDNPRTANVPIVCISARASRSDVAAGLAAGCDNYVTKPYKRKELLRELQDALVKRGVIMGDEPIWQG